MVENYGGIVKNNDLIVLSKELIAQNVDLEVYLSYVKKNILDIEGKVIHKLSTGYPQVIHRLSTYDFI